MSNTCYSFMCFMLPHWKYRASCCNWSTSDDKPSSLPQTVRGLAFLALTLRKCHANSALVTHMTLTQKTKGPFHLKLLRNRRCQQPPLLHFGYLTVYSCFDQSCFLDCWTPSICGGGRELIRAAGDKINARAIYEHTLAYQPIPISYSDQSLTLTKSHAFLTLTP